MDGAWGSWYPVSECSVRMGAGVQLANKSCDNPPPSNGGNDCPEAITQRYQICQEAELPGK